MIHKERVEVRSHYDQARETDNPALVSAQRSYPIILMYILYCHSGDLALHGMLHLEESDRTGQDKTRQDKTRQEYHPHSDLIRLLRRVAHVLAHFSG